MILVLFSIVDNLSFLIQLVVLVGLLVITLNIWAFVLYCSNAGSPYKNEKHAFKAVWVGRVAALWTIAICGKLVAGWFDPQIFDINR